MTAPPQSRRTIRFAHASVGSSVAASRLPVPTPITREWAWGPRPEGNGVRVCLIDSGVEVGHPALSDRLATYRVERQRADDSGDDLFHVVADDPVDVAGHGTACASVVRSLAPACELTSVRILGRDLRADGAALLAAVEWAVEQRFHLVNLSLSTRRADTSHGSTS